LQDRIEVAEVPKVTLVALSVHTSPEDGETDSASATVPLNPNIETNVKVELPVVPATTVTLVGFAVIE
jgi:hypothetical protein